MPDKYDTRAALGQILGRRAVSVAIAGDARNDDETRRRAGAAEMDSVEEIEEWFLAAQEEHGAAWTEAAYTETLRMLRRLNDARMA